MLKGVTRMDVVRAFHALESMESTSKRTAKMEVLQLHQDNVVLKYMFSAAYDWKRTFGIRCEDTMNRPTVQVTRPGGPVSRRGSGERMNVDADRWREFNRLLHRFEERKLTGNAAATAWGKFVSTCSVLERKWYSRILNRDMRVGAAAKTVNKNWVGLVPIWECQLADKYKPGELVLDEPSDKEPWRKMPMWVEPKPDGYRMFYLVENGKGTAFGRAGNDFANLQFVADAFAQVIDNAVVDTETIIDDNWNTTQSVLTTLPQNLTHKQEYELRRKIKIRCFDYLPLDDFNAAFCATPLRKRKKALLPVVKAARKTLHGFTKCCRKGIPIYLLPHKVVRTEDEIQVLYCKLLRMGYEGAMLKYPNAPYIGDRGRCWLKYKPTATYEGTVTGFREGSGKHVGVLGSFEVDVNGEIIYVGGGLSDAERKKFWRQRRRLLGRVLEFRVQADPRRVATARYPNFVRFRSDRKEV